MKRDLVCGYCDITGMPWSGSSDKHNPDTLAIGTTNGAGPRNIQIFFLSADGTVLHCLLGYWNPSDLQCEEQLAAQLNKVWQAPYLTRQQKDLYFQKLQLAHISKHSQEMTNRSKLQWFDENVEVTRPHSEFAVTVINPGDRAYQSHGHFFKPTDVVLHQRMATRPFMPYQQFDILTYSDYGAKQYDRRENSLDQELVTGKMDQSREEKRLQDMLASGWFNGQSEEQVAAYLQQSRKQMEAHANQGRERAIQQIQAIISIDKGPQVTASAAPTPQAGSARSVGRGTLNYQWNSPPSEPPTPALVADQQKLPPTPEYNYGALTVRATRLNAGQQQQK